MQVDGMRCVKNSTKGNSRWAGVGEMAAHSQGSTYARMGKD